MQKTSTTMQLPDTPTREFQSLVERHVGECTQFSPTVLRHNGKSKTTPPPSPPIKTPLRPVSAEVIPKKRANSGTGEKLIFSILSPPNFCKMTSHGSGFRLGQLLALSYTCLSVLFLCWSWQLYSSQFALPHTLICNSALIFNHKNAKAYTRRSECCLGVPSVPLIAWLDCLWLCGRDKGVGLRRRQNK